MNSTAELEQLNNPYRASACTDLSADVEVYDGPASDELRAFVGPKADFYLRKWRPRLEDAKGDVGMNWAAFFFGGAWMAYRRMYRAFFIYSICSVFAWTALNLVFMFVFHSQSLPASVSLLFKAMIGLVVAAYANEWYLAEAQRHILAARAQGLEYNETLQRLARRGGTSIGTAIGLPLAFGFAVFVVAFVFVVVIAVGAVMAGAAG